MKSSKGSAFEREICKRLSLWWTHGESDAVFWRTSNSGGRASVRSKTKLQTRNQYGDVCAVDPVGEPLIDAFAIELKRGYSRCSVADLLDAPEWAAEQEYAKWFSQARRSWHHAGSVSWMLIARRDKREPLVMVPEQAWALFSEEDWCDLRHVDIQGLTIHTLLPCETIVCIRLEDFLANVSPDNIRHLLEKGRTKDASTFKSEGRGNRGRTPRRKPNCDYRD